MGTSSKSTKKNAKKRSRQRQFKWLKDIANIFSSNKQTKLRQKSAKKTSEMYGLDFPILISIALLTLFGWIMIYSGSFYIASQRPSTILWEYNPFHFFIMQGIWIMAGITIAIITYLLPLAALRKLAYPGLILILILLIVVLILPGDINGAKLWIRIGAFSLQPSEFVKPLLIIVLADIFTKLKSPTKFSDYVMKYLGTFLGILTIVVGLVFAGRDLAMAGLIGIIGLSIFFMSDNSLVHNLVNLAVTAAGMAGGALLAIIEPYRLSRVETYINFLVTGQVADPLNTGYQLRQILIAVATGGWAGYGYGQSRQKYFYLQETAFTDTIFAVIAEEFGFIGSVLVIAGFAVICLRSLKYITVIKDKFNQLLIFGITIWFFSQTIIHLGVNVGLIPLTGMTLPFMSYGGSSFLSCAIGAGLLLNSIKTAKL